MFGVPVQVTVWPEAVQARDGDPAVCEPNVRPDGSVSVNVTVPEVAEPPLFPTVTLHVPVPPAGRLAGADLLIAKRGAVAVVTVQLAQLPALVETVFAIDATPSDSADTVTVNVFVTVAPAPTVTSCV